MLLGDIGETAVLALKGELATRGAVPLPAHQMHAGESGADSGIDLGAVRARK